VSLFKQIVLIGFIYLNGLFNVFITQEYHWCNSIGSYSVEHANAVVSDQNNNVYVTGSFRNTIDIDPGLSSSVITSNGESDIYIQKFNSNGNLEWAKTIGGSNFDYGKDIAIDNSGNVYITGVFKGTVDFNPGSGTENKTSNGQYDAFVLKLDMNGDFGWCYSFGGSNFDYGNAISVDSFGNVWIAGSFRSTVDFNDGAGTSSKTSAGGEDIYVLKLNFLGNFSSVNTMGGSDNDVATSLSIDNFGFVYITGTFEGTADFNPTNSVTNLTSNGNEDIFIEKLNFSGNMIFTKSIGGNGNDGATDIETDSYGNVYLTGYFSETVDFDPNNGSYNLSSIGYEDVYTLKLSNLGDFTWVKSFGNNNFNRGNSIKVDQYGNVLTAGFFRGISDINPGTASQTITSNGFMDIIIQKLDENGNFINAITLGSVGDDCVNDFTLDNQGNYLICGDFQNEVDFNPGPTTNNNTSIGDFDAYVLKLGTPSCTPNATSPLTLTLNLDDFCNETTWKITAPSGLILYSGGPYNCDPSGGGVDANTTINQILNLFLFECYEFTIIDSGGNGMGANGSWTIKDFTNATIVNGNGNFGNTISESFYINNEVTSLSNIKNEDVVLYPNPVQSNQEIEIKHSDKINNIRVFNSKGQLLNKTESVNYNSNRNSITINQSGIYFMIIETKNERLIKKIIVQ
tara:strand:- start:5540 stop:7588 length:2049 start_codon:yes stop_codon:yes gene_type:complete